MGLLLSLMTFLLRDKYFAPSLHFGEKLAHFTVKTRKSPAVLPSDDDHISMNNPAPDEHDPGSEGTRMSLRTLVESRVPSLTKPYRPCWWLPTGHVQTAYCVMANFDAVDAVVYKR